MAQNKIVLLLAADSSKRRKMWGNDRHLHTGNSFDNRKMLDMMVMGAKDYSPKPLPATHGFDVSESDDGVFSLKERK